MSLLAVIRADSINFALFVHVLGAMLLTGAVLTVVTATVLSRRTGTDAVGLRRFGLKTVAIAVLPAYILMRVGAQWTESQENLPDSVEDDTWLGIGYAAADIGALLIIASVILATIGLRRLRAGDGDGAAGGEGQARAVSIICMVLLVAYVVAVWAMTTKPT